MGINKDHIINMPAENLGIIFAFIALLSWGFGDFLIQKSVRQNSVMRTLFYICITGGAVLFPFIKDELWTSWMNGEMHFLLFSTALVIFAAAVLEFEGMKRGKLSIIEPILSFEMPIAILLSIVLRNEHLALIQIIPIIVAFFGFVLASQYSKQLFNFKKLRLEKGIFWALSGAALMGVVNFLVGVSSQETSALLTIWYTNIVILLMSAAVMTVKKEWKLVPQDLKRYSRPILMTCFFDNIAWIAYAYATTYIPISIATTISESYVVLTVMLGIFINREKVLKHQIAGIIMTVASVFVLSVF